MSDVPVKLFNSFRRAIPAGIVIVTSNACAAIKPDGPVTPVRVESKSAETTDPVRLTVPRPDELANATFLPPSMISLEFADGLHASMPIAALEMPINAIKWKTAKASATGDKMTLKGVRGDSIPIDSSVLRYLVDAEYARKLDVRLRELQSSDDELEQLVRDNPPPDEWLQKPSPDLTRDSWK